MTEPVLTLKGVTKTFRNRGRRISVLNDVTAEIPAGSITALIGRNGVGKSTLFSLITGFDSPDSGSVTVLGQTPRWQKFPEGVSYLAQYKPLFPSFTVSDMLKFGAHTNAMWDATYAATLITEAGIELDVRVQHLSPGQHARVAIAIALGRRPRLLLLDEPLAALDPIARQDVTAALMADAAEHGTSIIMSSHIITELADACDRVLLLAREHAPLDDDMCDIVADHYLLVGSGDPTTVANPDSIIHARPGTAIVRGARPDLATLPANLEVVAADIEEIVLAHLSTSEGAHS